MHLTTTALVAGFAALTSAFLVPPHFPEGVKDTRYHGGPPEQFKEFIHHVLEQRTTEINLDCPGCPFASIKSEKTRDDGSVEENVAWTQDVENVIHLEFDTHDHTFNVNHHPLLPLEKAQHAQSSSIKAYQIRKDSNAKSVEIPISFAMEVMPPMPSPHREGVSLIPVEFTILAINGVPVKVNTISVKLIQPPTGDFVIVHTEEISFENTPGAQTCEGATTWSVCRLKAMIMARMRLLVEATKDKADKAHGWVKEKTTGCGKGRHGGFWGHGRPAHMHGDGENSRHHGWGHHGHHGHQRSHHVGHAVHQTLRFFVIPALLGVIGGLTASAIGMLVGQMIVFVWTRAYRRGQRGPARVTEVVVEESEKDELLGEDDQILPAYEDAPRYEEAVGRDVEAEAVSHVHEKH